MWWDYSDAWLYADQVNFDKPDNECNKIFEFTRLGAYESLGKRNR